MILNCMEEFGREFHDQAPLRSTTSRALNLYLRADVGLEAYVGYLHHALSITRERGAMRHSTSGQPAQNRTAYFFAVLEDLLGFGAPGRSAWPEDEVSLRLRRRSESASALACPVRVHVVIEHSHLPPWEQRLGRCPEQRLTPLPRRCAAKLWSWSNGQDAGPTRPLARTEYLEGAGGHHGKRRKWC